MAGNGQHDLLSNLCVRRVGANGLIRPYMSKLAFMYKCIDVICILGAFVGVWWWQEAAFNQWFLVISLAASGAFFSLAFSRHLYRSWRIEPILHEMIDVLKAWAIAGAVLWAGLSLTGWHARYDPKILTMAFVAALFVLLGWRSILRVTWRELRRGGCNSRQVAVAGATELGVHMAELVGNATWMGLRFVGFFDDRATREIPEGLAQSIRGDFSALLAEARAGKVDMVLLTLPLRAEYRTQELIEALSDSTVSVYLVPDFFTFNLLHSRWTTFGDVPVLSVRESPFVGVSGWVKRLEDMVLGSIFLLLALLPMMLIALAVRLDSPGSVLFRQRRYGMNGEEIMVWKFRTMRVAEDGAEVHQAVRNDDRVTPVGRFLRRTSLDELPQIFQVLAGTMSLVGPRPHAVAHNEHYRSLVSGYMLRHMVKPGLTGWAQINGWRGETETPEKMKKRVEYDLAYIQNWSLWLDLRILLRTLWVVLEGKNAY